MRSYRSSRKNATVHDLGWGANFLTESPPGSGHTDATDTMKKRITDVETLHAGAVALKTLIQKFIIVD